MVIYRDQLLEEFEWVVRNEAEVRQRKFGIGISQYLVKNGFNVFFSSPVTLFVQAGMTEEEADKHVKAMGINLVTKR